MMRWRHLWIIPIMIIGVCCATRGYALAAGDANRHACLLTTEMSPGFRGYLPDCRAYEVVTPTYKGGSQVQLLLQAISADGSKLLGTGYGGFAGIENNEQGRQIFGAGIYQLSRGSEGWSAEALQPPATTVAHSAYVTSSTDLSQTLWELVEEPEPASNESPPEKEILTANTRYSFAIRVHEAGSPPLFEAVGPENPNTETRNFRDAVFQGASHDLSHIIFGIEAKEKATWPGDRTETGSESLYEYVGRHNQEPELVGVRNDGHLDGVPHLNEGANLISTCGTYLGAPSGSRYNAVSAAGNVVFFTALECAGTLPANALFARIDGENTVAISEPTRPISVEQGTGPGADECDPTCETATPREAIFQGASEDGTTVFFTTTQSLVNGDEGGDGEGNDLYEAKIQGNRLVGLVQVSQASSIAEAARLLGVVRVSADGGRVYFVAEGLLAGANATGNAPVENSANLYLYNTDNGRTQFIAVLSPEDSEDWKIEDNRRTAQTTRDGEFLLFPSIEKLTGAEDTSTAQQLFEYDAENQRIVRVSIGQQSQTGYLCPATKRLEAGFNCNGNITESVLSPTIPLLSYSQADPPIEATSKLALTEDGRVFFMSRAPLTPLAVEGSKNIYEFSRENVYLVAIGENPQLEFAAFQESFNEHDRLVSTDEKGTDIFFGAVGQLVPQDTDSQSDVYDARVEGGWPGIEAVAPCEGAACRSSSSVAPILPSAASSLVAAEAVGKASGKKVVKAAILTKAQKLANALRLCRKKGRSKRRACEARARRRYWTAVGPKKSNRGGK
jgi:hypothetical protein